MNASCGGPITAVKPGVANGPQARRTMMTAGHRGWRLWLAAAMSVWLAGIGVLIGQGAAGGSSFAMAAGGAAADGPVLVSAAPAAQSDLLAAVAERRITEFSVGAAFSGHGRYRGHRALGAELNGGQVQLPLADLSAARPPAIQPHASRMRSDSRTKIRGPSSEGRTSHNGEGSTRTRRRAGSALGVRYAQLRRPAAANTNS
jgi:hypothetical protein